jgi:glyoxylase-like metal-dependent hydrolase (beta-lactamase superfamily II)
MKVHHLNCGSFCPLLGTDAICHCLLVETDAHGLVLVDTGIGHRVSEEPARLMTRMNRWTLRPRFLQEESALTQVRARGFAPKDVRHVVVTHLDVDHAGGLQDFPHARVHVHAPELADARRKPGNSRYDAGLWRHVADWNCYEVAGDTWFGFGAVRCLRGLPPEVLIVPLPGHTGGHSGVAITANGRWLLHAGDAYLEPVELEADKTAPWKLRLAARLSSFSSALRHDNLQRLRELRAGRKDAVTIFSAHSLEEFRALVTPA